MPGSIQDYYYRNTECLAHLGGAKADPGDESELFKGRLGTYKVSCFADDSAARLEVVEVAMDVITGGIFGFGGRFGEKKFTYVKQDRTRTLSLYTADGVRETIELKHVKGNRTKVLVSSE